MDISVRTSVSCPVALTHTLVDVSYISQDRHYRAVFSFLGVNVDMDTAAGPTEPQGNGKLRGGGAEDLGTGELAGRDTLKKVHREGCATRIINWDEVKKALKGELLRSCCSLASLTRPLTLIPSQTSQARPVSAHVELSTVTRSRRRVSLSESND